MKKLILCLTILLGLSTSGIQAKDLVVYFSAQGHTQAVAEEIARVTGADILRIEAADPYAVIGSYKKEVLILHGDNDGIVPISYSRRAVEAYSSARLETFHGAGHGFYGNDFEAAAGFILEYMSEHLNQAKSMNR